MTKGVLQGVLQGVRQTVLLGWVTALFTILICTPALAIDYQITITGGPTGTSINTFANAMAVYLPQVNTNISAVALGSRGSVENLKRVANAESDFGICYTVDSDLYYKGKLAQGSQTYANLRVMGYLYGAPAQLVVPADSEIISAMQLKGKRVAMGIAKSGAAVSAERFFRHIGIFNDVKPFYMGYADAADAFKAGRIDAFWVLVGFPNQGVMKAGAKIDIRLIDVGVDAEKTGFYNAFAYAPTLIPAGTYGNAMPQCQTFQNIAMLNTHRDVSDDLVYTIMKTLWSEEGMAAMAAAKTTFKEMTLANGFKGTSVPLHPGAVQFWMEMGKQIPDHAQPPMR